MRRKVNIVSNGTSSDASTISRAYGCDSDLWQIIILRSDKKTMDYALYSVRSSIHSNTHNLVHRKGDVKTSNLQP